MIKKRIKKRILGLALKILKSYFHNTDYSIFIFDRANKEIQPFLWHPRYLPKKDFQSSKSVTNDWSNFGDLLSFINDFILMIWGEKRLLKPTVRILLDFLIFDSILSKSS